jgi:hypothetical protein
MLGVHARALREAVDGVGPRPHSRQHVFFPLSSHEQPVLPVTHTPTITTTFFLQ